MTNTSARRCRVRDRHGIETPTDSVKPIEGRHTLEREESVGDDHPITAATAGTDRTETAADQRRQGSINRALSRRGFLAGSAGIAAAAVLPGIAAGQNGTDDGIESVFTDVAISATVPALDDGSYTGLFLQIVNVEATEGIDVGVESCDILPSDAEIMAYEARLIDRIEGDRQSTSAIVYVEEGNEEVHEGKLFVIDSTRSCPENFIALRLERIGAGVIDIDDEETDDGETDSAAPGFGVGAAVVGLGASSLVALRRRLQTESS